MQVGYKTDIGKNREANEDSYFVDDDNEVFIVADGIGGHQAGEIASKLAVSTIAQSLLHNKNSLLSEGAEPKNASVHISNIIQEAIQKANGNIYKLANASPHLKGMGTTVVLALRYKDKIYIAHVGDSRALLVRHNGIIQLTEDHSLVGELVRKGEVSREEARKHHLRHIITRSLGIKEVISADITSVTWQKGDYFLLCTDGLTNMVSDEDIKGIVLDVKDPTGICEQLVEFANNMGGHDNITVVVLHLNENMGDKKCQEES